MSKSILMHFTHVGKVDLNLLAPLYVLLEERHISKAARRCGLSQPAMSRALARARSAIGDELLVRIDGTFERTVRADRLLLELHDLLPRLDKAFRGDAFDPSESRHVFQIAATEYASSVLVPGLLKRLFAVAPHMRATVVSWNTAGQQHVESGRVELALIGEHDAPSFDSEKVFSDDFVCLVSNAHPFRGQRMTLKAYLSYPHVDIAVTAGRNPFIDNALSTHGHRRRIVFRTPFPISAILTTGISDMIYTTPRRMARTLRPIAGVRILEAPRELPRFAYAMAWHRRLGSDVVQLWLRSLVRAVAKEL